VAVPGAVDQGTVACVVGATLRVTVNVTLAAASVTGVGSLMLIPGWSPSSLT
jgi:hypothetical protein